MKLNTVTEALENLAPPVHAEAWDNVGLLINPLRPRTVRRILLTIDLTEAVADEAVQAGTDLILTYHPVLFNPVNRLDAARAQDRAVMKLVQKNIAVYSPHTALDAVIGGVNDWLAEAVGEGEVSVLYPVPGGDAGQGRLVTLQRPISLKTLAGRVRKYLGLGRLRIARAAGTDPVRSIALCAGAGSDALRNVRADCYLTGEMSHHSILAAIQNGTHVILCEHTNTERGYLPVLARLLRKALGNRIDISIAAMDSDPIKFN